MMVIPTIIPVQKKQVITTKDLKTKIDTTADKISKLTDDINKTLDAVKKRKKKVNNHKQISINQ